MRKEKTEQLAADGRAPIAHLGNPTSYTFETATEKVKTVSVMLRDVADNQGCQAGYVRTS